MARIAYLEDKITRAERLACLRPSAQRRAAFVAILRPVQIFRTASIADCHNSFPLVRLLVGEVRRSFPPPEVQPRRRLARETRFIVARKSEPR